MANLKDINYGIGKYLEASDASAIPGIGNNRKNIDLLNFKVATNNAYALYNFKDGMIDAYQTEGGVDTGTSTNEIYDSSGKYYSGAEIGTVAGNDSYTKLLLHADGSNGGTTFTDSSSSGRSVTLGGDVHTDTTIKKIGTASAQFDGTGDYLQMADSADWATGADNFTFDFWIYQESFGGYVYNQEAGSTWLRMEQKSGGMEFNFYNNGSYANGWQSNMPWSSGTLQDSWHHIALERDGANIRGWIDGTEVTMTPGLDAPGSNNVPDIASVVWLGGKVSGSGYFEGYLDEFRFSKGIARYDANFTPETLAGYGEAYAIYNNMTLISNAQTAQTAPTEGRLMLYEETSIGSTTLDTDIKGYVSRDGGTTYTQTPLTQDVVYNPKAGGFDSYNKLLLHCDGAAGSTTFTDSSDSGHTVTANGSFELTTTDNEWKFGGAGATADGTSGTWLSVPDSTDWAFGSGNFTLDMWIYPKTTNQILMGVREAAFSWELLYYNNAINFWTDAAQNDWPLGTGGVASNSIGDITNQWTHVAFVRNGNDWIFFINGVESGTGDGGNYSIRDVASTLSIGARNNGTYYQWNGYMDEIRISKGIARWTSNFTPPTNEYGLSQRLLSGAVDISGQPSGTSMKYKVETLNQSASKICRLHGASLLWA